MRAEPEPRVGGGVGFGVPSQIHVGFHIPEQAKVAVAHWADACSEFVEESGFSGRLLHYTYTQTQQVVEHVAKHVVLFENSVCVTTRRRG